MLLCLKLCYTSLLGNKALHIVLYACYNLAIVHLYRVYEGLVVEEFLLHQCLKRFVDDISVGGISHLSALSCKCLRILQNFGVENC